MALGRTDAALAEHRPDFAVEAALARRSALHDQRAARAAVAEDRRRAQARQWHEVERVAADLRGASCHGSGKSRKAGQPGRKVVPTSLAGFFSSHLRMRLASATRVQRAPESCR